MDIDRYNTSKTISQLYVPVEGANWKIWRTVDFAEEKRKEVIRRINRMILGYSN